MMIEDGNIIKKLEGCNSQLHVLMQITEAINENASVSALFEIYKNAIFKYYQPESLSLCVNTTKRMEVFSTRSDRKLENYESALKEFGKKKSKLLRSVNGEIFIPVYHKQELISLVHLEKMRLQGKEELKFLRTITNFVAIAIENKRMFKHRIEQENYRTQLALARQIQHSLMPLNFSDTRELEFKTIYIPHSELGGDYFDFFHIENSHVSIFCIADVAGKGIPAALLMANLQASLRRLSINYTNLEYLIEGLNKAMFESTKGEQLVTIFLASYNVISNELKYINAGHPYPILYTQTQGSRFLKQGTTPIGITETLSEVTVGCEIIQNETIILSYTDGLEELRNSNGDMLGHHNIINNLHRVPFGNIELIAENMEMFIEKFREKEPIVDDITVLLCKIKPDGIVK